MLKTYNLQIFFILAYLLSWYPFLLAKFGIPTSGGINPLGPLVAGVILTAFTSGRKGLGEFLRRIVRAKVAPRWYLAVILIPTGICIVSAGLNLLMGAPLPSFESIRNWRELPERFLFTLLFVGLGEEPGWRGYALEQMQKKRSPIASSCILAIFWAGWHFPLMGTEFSMAVIPAFLISVLAGTFVLTWIYNGTGGSVLLPMILHAVVNTVGAGYVFRMFSGADVVRLWYVYSFIWLILSLMILFATGQIKIKQRSDAAPALQR